MYMTFKIKCLKLSKIIGIIKYYRYGKGRGLGN